jgi:hypothetical protein
LIIFGNWTIIAIAKKKKKEKRRKEGMGRKKGKSP